MAKTRVMMVGTGGMARHHMTKMFDQSRTTAFTGMVEVDETQRRLTGDLFAQHGRACPPFYDTIRAALAADEAPDAAFIITPHKYHLENTLDCVDNGIDVLLEKPMVMNQREAKRLIAARDKSRRLVVVAFPGSMSPAVRKAKAMIAAGALGEVSGIVAHVHQNWKLITTGRWRQQPEISGGGFLFDTGSHMVNTVVDLIGEDVAEVSATLDNRGAPVEINSAVLGRFAGGATMSLAGLGDSIQCCSQVRVLGDKAVLETGVWGERLLLKKAPDADFKPVAYPASKGVWQQFLAVRSGRQENPCPPEVGLRFARLMDGIRKSADTGRTVRLPGAATCTSS